MKVLILEWDSFGHEYMLEAFQQEGCQTDSFPWPFGEEAMRENPKLEKKLSNVLEQKNYHFVFSFNFFPVAAKVCHQQGTRYVSWVYDSPFLLMYSKHAGYSTNQIYVFDQSVVKEFRKQGYHQVSYLPMAAPVEYYDRLNQRKTEEERYQSDISFVGSTYGETRNDFYTYLEKMDTYTAGYLQAVMNAQREVVGASILEESLTEDILNRLRKVCPMKKEEDEWESDAWLYANYFLARKLTAQERTDLLQRLAQEQEVKLYTPEETNLPGVTNCGPVEYLTEMPLVFKHSKINLNITLRSIRTGIPLRAMDIMGCGGFLLTNFQEDFLEHFEPGTDYVYYTDQEDLANKAAYYLEHEEERLTIARNGYEKIKAFHTYRHRARKILEDMLILETVLNDRILELEEIHRKQGGCWYEMKIDWEQLDDSSLVQETEKQMLWMAQEKETLFQLRDCLMALAEDALKVGGEENYDRLVDYFNKNKVKTLYVVFSEVFYLYLFVQLYQLEKQAGMAYTISQYSSCQELIRVYRELTFYLRRLDSRLGAEYQKEIFQFLKKEKLSPTALMLMLRSNSSLEADIIERKLKEYPYG